MKRKRLKLDGPWKEAIEVFLPFFFELLFKHYYDIIDWEKPPRFLDTELQEIGPLPGSGKGVVDKLIEVHRKDGSTQLLYIHIEIQCQDRRGFAKRMFDYNIRLRGKLRVMPVSLAVFGDKNPKWRPRFHVERMEGTKLRFEFDSVKLLDFRFQEAMLEESSNPIAAVVLAHLKTLETQDQPDQRLERKYNLIRGLYKRALTNDQVRLLFSVIDSMMALSDEQQLEFRERLMESEREQTMPLISPTQKIWLKEGIEKGRIEGIEKGRIEGIEKGRIEGIEKGRFLGRIEMGLEMQFGEKGLELMDEIRKVTDIRVLERINEVIVKNTSLEDIRALLK